MPDFKVIFYETADGKSPIEDFLNSLDVKMRAKLVAQLSLLESLGNQLREPYSKHLDDGIFELRCKLGSNITRTLYFFFDGANIILTNGFVKKSQRTPPNEIALAKARRADWRSRYENLGTIQGGANAR